MELTIKLILLNALFLVSLSGCEDIQGEFSDNTGPSTLSRKPAVLKMTYLEVAQRKAEFAEGTPQGHSLTYIEEPRSERKQVYIEVYDDLTYSKQINYLEPESDFPADYHVLPDDMPEMKKVIYSNGFARGYDKAGRLILEEPFDDSYWVDPSEFGSQEEAIAYVIDSYFNPKAIAAKTLESAEKYADDFERLGEQAAMVTTRLEPSTVSQSPSARNTGSPDEVVEEKTYLLPEYGAVYRTEGYTSEGTLKDIEHNFYAFTPDGAFVMPSSHYRNKEYSEAYDLSYIEHSDIFYENYKIEANK